MPTVKSQFWEDHNKDISFFYTGKANVIGRDYADAVISNTRNAHYIRFATITYDESLQSTEENIVNEELLLRVENYVGSQYVANEATIKLVGHIVGKRVDKNKFKCVIAPEIEYMDIPEIMITEEINSNGNKIGLWLHTEGIKRIYTTKIYSHARNSYPLNTEYIDSKYYINLLSNDDMVYNVDTTNLSADVARNQFLSGVNIYSGIDRRLTKLESIKYPDIKFASISTDTSWVPQTTGNSAVSYQRIPLVNADYSTALSTSFIRIQGASTNGFMVTEPGLYSVQFTSGLNTRSAITDSNVELSLFKNDDRVACSTMQFKLKADNGVHYTNPIGIGSGVALLSLSTSDIVRLQFRFLEGANNGVVNDGCQILVTKLLHTP